ncbi:MAG: hypothetical protein ACRYGA_10865 [Janthinobacterium lividum]
MEKDFLLLQMTLAPGAASDIDADCRAFAHALSVAHGADVSLHRVAMTLDGIQAYVYLKPSTARVADALEPELLGTDFAQYNPWARGVRASWLECRLDLAGASQGQSVRFHYVVEMDPEAGWMPEISRWYDTEHLPGLANVEGCVRAMRLVNHGHGPMSLACYDLVSQETLGSPPWLAVRATSWSDITRPHFTNTKRTMFGVPPAA